MPRFVKVVAAAAVIAGFSPHVAWIEERAQEAVAPASGDALSAIDPSSDTEAQGVLHALP